MEKEDARKQSREVLHERRKQVIRLHRKGAGVMQIVEQTGLSWSGVTLHCACSSKAGRLHSSPTDVTLPLFRVVLNPRFTRPFYAVPRTSAARTASG